MRALVMAKAPVPGLAKTRLAAVVGDHTAADLAAAGLLDTLTACRAATSDCVIALTGSLGDAVRAQEIRAALTGWTVLRQRGDGFDERLVHAHQDAGPGPLIQVGMDTPQVTSAQLQAAGAALEQHDTVLGMADDGGWWVLGRHEPGQTAGLRGVPMSTPTTGQDTRTALRARGLSVGLVPTLRDVDTVEDAEAVATTAPDTLFAQAWTATRVPS